eukprot:scaffold9973_cov125-Isochrysis_galbana.AAC.3
MTYEYWRDATHCSNARSRSAWAALLEPAACISASRSVWHCSMLSGGAHNDAPQPEHTPSAGPTVATCAVHPGTWRSTLLSRSKEAPLSVSCSATTESSSSASHEAGELASRRLASAADSGAPPPEAELARTGPAVHACLPPFPPAASARHQTVLTHRHRDLSRGSQPAGSGEVVEQTRVQAPLWRDPPTRCIRDDVGRGVQFALCQQHAHLKCECRFVGLDAGVSHVPQHDAKLLLPVNEETQQRVVCGKVERRPGFSNVRLEDAPARRNILFLGGALRASVIAGARAIFGVADRGLEKTTPGGSAMSPHLDE